MKGEATLPTQTTSPTSFSKRFSAKKYDSSDYSSRIIGQRTTQSLEVDSGEPGVISWAPLFMDLIYVTIILAIELLIVEAGIYDAKVVSFGVAIFFLLFTTRKVFCDDEATTFFQIVL